MLEWILFQLSSVLKLLNYFLHLTSLQIRFLHKVNRKAQIVSHFNKYCSLNSKLDSHLVVKGELMISKENYLYKAYNLYSVSLKLGLDITACKQHICRNRYTLWPTHSSSLQWNTHCHCWMVHFIIKYTWCMARTIPSPSNTDDVSKRV